MQINQTMARARKDSCSTKNTQICNWSTKTIRNHPRVCLMEANREDSKSSFSGIRIIRRISIFMRKTLPKEEMMRRLLLRADQGNSIVVTWRWDFQIGVWDLSNHEIRHQWHLGNSWPYQISKHSIIKVILRTQTKTKINSKRYWTSQKAKSLINNPLKRANRQALAKNYLDKSCDSDTSFGNMKTASGKKTFA